MHATHNRQNKCKQRRIKQEWASVCACGNGTHKVKNARKKRKTIVVEMLVKCTKPNPWRDFSQPREMARSPNDCYMRQHPSNLFIIKSSKNYHFLFAIFAIFATEFHLDCNVFFLFVRWNEDRLRLFHVNLFSLFFRLLILISLLLSHSVLARFY